jgi:hypothetical protein
MDAMCNLHRSLVNEGKLEGITFNTGRVSYNKETKIFTIAVKREKPLEIADTDIIKEIEKPTDKGLQEESF